MILIPVGEDSIETVIGMGTDGTIDGFHSNSLNKTGKIGIAADIGKEIENGTWKNMNLFHHKDSRK